MPIKYDGFISSWNFVMMYRDEEAALQKKLAEWQDNPQNLDERIAEASKMIADWRNKVENLRKLLSEGADPDMPDVLYSLVTDSWLGGVQGLEEAANEMEMAIKESDPQSISY